MSLDSLVGTFADSSNTPARLGYDTTSGTADRTPPKCLGSSDSAIARTSTKAEMA